MTYGRPFSPCNSHIQVFSPPLKRLPRGRCAAKYMNVRVLHGVAVLSDAGCGRRPSPVTQSPGNGSQAKIKMETKMTAIGYVRKEQDGRYLGSIRTISIRADVEILPNTNKTTEAQPDYRVLTQGIEIGAGWTKKGESSHKEYVSLALAAPEFGPRKLYANLGRAAGQDDDNLYALIWNPND